MRCSWKSPCLHLQVVGQASKAQPVLAQCWRPLHVACVKNRLNHRTLWRLSKSCLRCLDLRHPLLVLQFAGVSELQDRSDTGEQETSRPAHQLHQLEEERHLGRRAEEHRTRDLRHDGPVKGVLSLMKRRTRCVPESWRGRYRRSPPPRLSCHKRKRSEMGQKP